MTRIFHERWSDDPRRNTNARPNQPSQMITSIGLSRFKAFRELPPIRLPALTVLCGKNSSGKSSILQSLLLLKQTLGGEPPHEAVSLDGEYLQYTHLREISYGLPQEAVASIAYSFTLEDRPGNSGQIAFEIRHKEVPPDLKRKGPVINKFTWEDSDGDTGSIRLRSGHYKWPRRAGRDPVVLPRDAEPVGGPEVRFQRFLPFTYVQEIRQPDSESESKLFYTMPLWLIRSPVVRLCNQLEEELEHLRYLGPSRAVPRRAYIYYSERHFDLDPDGGNAAHVYWLRRNERVKLLDGMSRLQDAVQYCLELMGLPQQVSPRRSSKIVYQLMVGIKNHDAKQVALPDVGFGYSQVLPIVLRGLLADERALVLFEQPEIHLHPSSKARLADLFIAFIKSGKRVIVETHSTEFINALQLHVLRGDIRPKEVNIVFVEGSDPGAADGARARQLQLRDDGMFNEWPEGFCDESERLARELLESRVGRQSNADE